VEADRSFNLDNFTADTSVSAAGKIFDTFGGHSPFNVDFAQSEYPFKVPVQWQRATLPLQDILGSVERKKGEITTDRGVAHAASYLDCIRDNYLVDADWYRVSSCDSDQGQKTIHSWMEHKSPTKTEYEALIKAKATPSMPVDHDRYIDFQGSGGYTKIEYPNLFRVELSTSEELTYTGALAKINKILTEKQLQIQKL